VAAIIAIAIATSSNAADSAAPDQDKKSVTVIQTNHEPVKAKIITPESGPDGPGRAHLPIRIIVPDEPITPPRNPNSEPLK